MKKSNYLLTVFFISALLSTAACGQSEATSKPSVSEKKSETAVSSTPTDEIKASIEGRDFVLKNNAGICQIVFGDQTIDLGIPWQCDFHRATDQSVRVYPRSFYSEAKKYPKNYRNTQIFLIEHSTSEPDNPKDCRTQLRAVKISDGKVMVSKTTSKLAACLPFQWEDKNFIGVFE